MFEKIWTGELLPETGLPGMVTVLLREVALTRAAYRDVLHRQPDLEIMNMTCEKFFEDFYLLLQDMEHGSKRIAEIVANLPEVMMVEGRIDRTPINRIVNIGPAVGQKLSLFDEV